MSRATTYLDQYQRAATAAARWADIQTGIQNDVLRAQEAEAIAAAERANLSALEESFRVRPTEMSEINSILKEQNAAFQAQRAAGAAASQARAQRLQSQQDEVFGLPSGRALGPEMSADVLRRKLATGELTRSDATALISEYQRRFPSADLGPITSALGTARYAPEEGGGGESRAAIQARTAVALDRLFLSSPQAAYGGTEAQAAMDARQKAPSGASQPTLATQADLLDAYLELLEDGEVTAEEWAATIGYEDAAAAAADFKSAQALYQQAKAEKSFRNDQLKYFEPSWLQQAKATAQADLRAQQARAAAPSDPRKEALRQELRARGYDPDDPYTRYKGTPLHGYLTTADRIYSSVGGDVQPASPQQDRIAEFVRQAQAQGGRFTLSALEPQLQKMGLDPRQMEEAAGFALAYARAREEERQPPDQRALQQSQDQRREEQAAARELAAEQARKAAEAEAAKKEELSRALSQRAALGGDASRYYQALRAAGADPETARAQTDRAFPEFARPTRGGPLDLAGAEAEQEAALAASIPSVTPEAPQSEEEIRALFAQRMQPPAPTPAPATAAAPPSPATATPSSFDAAQADPTNPAYRYLAQPDGSYVVYRDGLPTGRAAAGSRAAQSIASVLSGGKPLARPAPAPAPAAQAPPTEEAGVPLVPVQIGGRTVMAPSSATAPAPEPTLELPELFIQGTKPGTETPEQRLERLLREAAGG